MTTERKEKFTIFMGIIGNYSWVMLFAEYQNTSFITVVASDHQVVDEVFWTSSILLFPGQFKNIICGYVLRFWVSSCSGHIQYATLHWGLWDFACQRQQNLLCFLSRLPCLSRMDILTMLNLPTHDMVFCIIYFGLQFPRVRLCSFPRTTFACILLNLSLIISRCHNKYIPVHVNLSTSQETPKATRKT